MATRHAAGSEARAPKARIGPVRREHSKSLRSIERSVRMLALLLGVIVIGVIPVGIVVRLPVSVSASGHLEPNRSWRVRPLVAGIVVQVLVKAGAHVTAGQLLGQLDTLELSAIAFRARAQYREMQMSHSRLLEALPIERKLDNGRLLQAEASVLKARAALRLELVLSNRGPDEDSLLRSFVFGQHIALDNAVASVQSAEAEVMAAQSQIQRDILRQLEVRQTSVSMERLRQESAFAAERRHRVKLFAPANGIVITEQTEQLLGRLVSEGEEVLTIADTSRWQASLLVGEAEIARIREGDSVRLELVAFRRGLGNGLLRGVVRFVGNAPSTIKDGGTSKGSSYVVLVTLEANSVNGAASGQLRGGLSTRAKIITRRVRLWQMVWETLWRTPHG